MPGCESDSAIIAAGDDEALDATFSMASVVSI
jgi:hypothetical protein